MLSNSTKVGIGIGTGLGALLLFSIGVFVGLNHQKDKRTAKHQLHADAMGIYTQNIERVSLENSHELEQVRILRELPDCMSQRPAELS